MDEFVVVIELHKELLAVVVRGKDFALVANHQTRAVGHFAEQLLDVGQQLARRLVAEIMAVGRAGIGPAAIVPGEGDGPLFHESCW